MVLGGKMTEGGRRARVGLPRQAAGLAPPVRPGSYPEASTG